MRNLGIFLLSVAVFSSSLEVYATNAKKKMRPKSSDEAPAAPSPLDPEEAKQLNEANRLIHDRRYDLAAQKLYRLSRNPLLRDRREELKYKLGLVLMEMGLNQVAAVEFLRVAVKGKSRFLKQSLEKLSIAADALDFDTLLNLAIAKITVGDFPAIHKDMLFYRIGEFQMKKNDFAEAAKNFNKVDPSSRYYSRAKYSQALALAEDQKPALAAAAFDELYQSRSSSPISDPIRVSALVGKARTLYQDRKWDDSIEYFRQVPRDSTVWHDTLFESSWAMLRGAKFRSALSNFHSLHSPFYDDEYLPESLVLRAIVYLYICKFGELEKDLTLFDSVYGPLRRDILQYLSRRPDGAKIYQDYLVSTANKGSTPIPIQAVRKIEKEYDFSQNYNYLQNLVAEMGKLDKLSAGFKNSPMGKYARKLITLRMKKTEKKLGLIVKKHLFEIKTELRDFAEQVGFLRLEVTNMQKEEVKKQMTKQDEQAALEEMGEGKPQVDQKADRKFYIQNGYEYWPFQGEYWLDELGNYHYLGVSSCQK